jgi:hypothetical protein
MRIDANTAAIQPFAGAAEARHSASVSPQAGTTPDSVNLSALASGGEMDERATAHTAGLITGNASGALSAHGHLDPERALRLVGLLD